MCEVIYIFYSPLVMDRFIDFGFGLIIFPFPSPNFGHFFLSIFSMFWQRVLQNRQKKSKIEKKMEREKKSTCSASLAHKPINTEFDFWKNPSITNCATRAPLMMVYVLRLRADSLFMNGRKEGRMCKKVDLQIRKLQYNNQSTDMLLSIYYFVL